MLIDRAPDSKEKCLVRYVPCQIHTWPKVVSQWNSVIKKKISLFLMFLFQMKVLHVSRE